MNVEITATNFPLIYTLPNEDSTNLDKQPEPTNAIFVHVQNKATRQASFPTLQNEGWYICVLYVHAVDCIGRFIVPSSKVSEWTAQSKVRVFISAADSLTKTLAKSSKLDTVKHPSPKVTSTPIVRAFALKYISIHAEESVEQTTLAAGGAMGRIALTSRDRNLCQICKNEDAACHRPSSGPNIWFVSVYTYNANANWQYFRTKNTYRILQTRTTTTA